MSGLGVGDRRRVRCAGGYDSASADEVPQGTGIFEYYSEDDVNPDMEFNQKMIRASERCANLAASEQVMGYIDTSVVYLAMSTECRNITSWVVQYRNQKASSDAGPSEERRVSS
jgi:hypothetical protein